MSVPFFDLGRLVRSERSDLHFALDQVIESGYFVGGPVVDNFEQKFANYIGCKHVSGVGNGLDAIRILLEVHEIGQGDEIIVPGFTYYATWLAVMQTGAQIVPVDVDLNNAAISADLIQAAVTPRTKAIVVVHLFGHAANMVEIDKVAKRNSLLVFEDAAQAHGLTTNLGRIGSYGDGTAFSFYPTKNLGALGDAGGIATNDDNIRLKITSLRSYGQGTTKYDHVSRGWNTRLDPIQAAFLTLHLEKLNHWNERRREIAGKYADALGDASTFALGTQSIGESVWHHFTIAPPDRNEARKFLLEEFGIQTDVHYPYFIHTVKPAKESIPDDFINQKLPNSELLSERIFSLPMGPWLADNEIAEVSVALRALAKHIL